MAEPIVRAAGLEKRYGLRPVLRDVSFELEPGGALVVTGPNGAGKSTLLRLIGGLAAPSRGSLEIRTERRKVGFLGHEPLVYR
ncbi:MAG TPA: ATP-binding cassette domain-containing protein, partial [Gaiella sp.]|nr:ATP-binding cassette domain-containing protein [Gaiella sp.]